MFENKKAAVELHELLKEICQIIDEGRDLVLEGDYTEQEQNLYCKNMEDALGKEIGEILNAIWAEHPELEPS